MFDKNLVQCLHFDYLHAEAIAVLVFIDKLQMHFTVFDNLLLPNVLDFLCSLENKLSACKFTVMLLQSAFVLIISQDFAEALLVHLRILLQ